MKLTLREWQKLFKTPRELIVQASVKDGTDSWQPFPIGMCYGYMSLDHSARSLQLGSHTETVFCAINSQTDTHRRGALPVNRAKIVQTLDANSIKNSQRMVHIYFQVLPHHKFVISPEGNGIDCHRHYEALLAGCIPIMEHNPLIEEKYKGLPILYTTDYSEITEEYLNKRYDEMIDTTYDFSRLFIANYTDEQQSQIRDCGNYWTERLGGRKFYV